MRGQAIGVFDSGIGGLSILKALRAELPQEDFLYIADSGHAPYGERDDAHVLARARAITTHLLRQNIKALVKAELQRVSPTSWVKVDASGSAVVTRTVEQSQQNVPGDMQSFNFKLEVTPLWNLVE